MEGKELWGVGKTFMIAVLALASSWYGSYLGFLLPETFESVLWAVCGMYGLKTVGHKAAGAYKSKNDHSS